jgi:uncharacterized protein YjiS (DUF1127 family)
MFRFVCEFLTSYKNYFRSLRELKMMTDRQLKDIGLTRGDIYRVAYKKSGM